MKNPDGTYTTQMERIVAFLHTEKHWLPTFELQSRDTKFGFIGSSGEQRVRELARNASCVPEKLRDKVERRRGGEIGLNPKYEYFRYRSYSAIKCARFEAGLPAEQVFAA